MNPWFVWKMLHDASQEKFGDCEKTILGIVSIVASIAAVWIVLK